MTRVSVDGVRGLVTPVVSARQSSVPVERMGNHRRPHNLRSRRGRVSKSRK